MFSDRRQFERRAISRLARIQVSGGALPRDCLLTNISDGGVRLHVEGIDVPDRFVLLLSDGSGSAKPRDCNVVWRLGYELGAAFIDIKGRDGTARGHEATEA